MATQDELVDNILDMDSSYSMYWLHANPRGRKLYMNRRAELLKDTVNNTNPFKAEHWVSEEYLHLRQSVLREKCPRMFMKSGIRPKPAAGMPPLQQQQPPDVSYKVFIESCKDHRRYRSSGNLHGMLGFEGDSRSWGHHRYNSDIGLVTSPFHPGKGGLGSIRSPPCPSSGFYEFSQPPLELRLHTDAVVVIKFAHNSEETLASGSADGTLIIINLGKKSKESPFRLQGHTRSVTDLDWSSSNDFLVSSSLDGTLRLWETSLGTCLRLLEDGTHTPALCCNFLPQNNNLILCGTQRGTIQVFNTSTGHRVKGAQTRLSDRIVSMTFDQQISRFWAGDDKGYLFACTTSPTSGKVQVSTRFLLVSGCQVTSISYKSSIVPGSLDAFLLVSVTCNQVFLVRVAQRRNGNMQVMKTFDVKHRQWPIRSCFSPLVSQHHGFTLVSGSEDCMVYVYNPRGVDETHVDKLHGHASSVLSVCWNYNETLLASSDTEGKILLRPSHPNKLPWLGTDSLTPPPPPSLCTP